MAGASWRIAIIARKPANAPRAVKEWTPAATSWSVRIFCRKRSLPRGVYVPQAPSQPLYRNSNHSGTTATQPFGKGHSPHSTVNYNASHESSFTGDHRALSLTNVRLRFVPLVTASVESIRGAGPNHRIRRGLTNEAPVEANAVVPPHAQLRMNRAPPSITRTSLNKEVSLGATGFEPVTSCMSSKHSNQLS